MSDNVKTSVRIKVYQRSINDQKNAAIVLGQDVLNDSLPVKVIHQEQDTASLSNHWQPFNCPSCAKLYAVDVESHNLQFQCVQCRNNLLVVLNKKKIEPEIQTMPSANNENQQEYHDAESQEQDASSDKFNLRPFAIARSGTTTQSPFIASLNSARNDEDFTAAMRNVRDKDQHSSVSLAAFRFALASLFISFLAVFSKGKAFDSLLNLGALLCFTGGLFGVAGIIHGILREKKIRLAVWGILLAMLSYLLLLVFGTAYIGP